MLGWWINKQSQLNNRKMIYQQQEELNRALFEAVSKGNVDECQRLIQAGANVNFTNDDGWTPLHWAAFDGHLKVCRLLINEGRADVHAVTNDNRTPLHLAAWWGHVAVCRFLIEQGAIVNATNRFGWTPLHLAAQNGHVEVCQLMINTGRANVNAIDGSDRTPLHWAARYGHVELCRLLVNKGADVNATDDWGWTPLDLAISNHAVEILVYFYVHGVVNFHQPDHTGRRPWDNLTAQQQGTLTEAMAEHQEKIAILQTRGLPNELARLVMGYL